MALKEDYIKIGQMLFRFRSYIPLILVPVYIIAIYSHFIEIPPLADQLYWSFVCFVISILGILVRVLTIGYVPPNTSGRNVKNQLADCVNTTGIYSIVRHPLYLGNLLIWLGVSLRPGSITLSICTIIFFWVYYEKIMFTEEEYLRAKFGSSYEDWANKTPAVIPSFRLWIGSSHTFSLRKILRKECDGFYALIVVFFFLDILLDYSQNRNDNIIDMVSSSWLITICISSLLYIILKVIKKKTGLLKR